MKLAAIVLAVLVVSAAAQDVVYKPGDGVSLPRATKQVHPEYTPEARASKVKGTVVVEAVVRADGTVGDVDVVRSLDAGLDANATRATKEWIFEPGKKDGNAVSVRVQIAHTFNLK